MLVKTLSPCWDQTLIFDNVTLFGSPEEVADDPPYITLEFFDHDKVGSDKFIGRVMVS